MSEPVNVDVKLGINKFHVDEGHPHIVIREHPNMAALRTLTLACPAGLYKLQDDGSVQFDYAGCLVSMTCWNNGTTHAAPSVSNTATANLSTETGPPVSIA